LIYTTIAKNTLFKVLPQIQPVDNKFGTQALQQAHLTGWGGV